MSDHDNDLDRVSDQLGDTQQQLDEEQESLRAALSALGVETVGALAAMGAGLGTDLEAQLVEAPSLADGRPADVRIRHLINQDREGDAELACAVRLGAGPSLRRREAPHSSNSTSYSAAWPGRTEAGC